MQIITIRGVEFEVSTTDADFVEKCEDELDNLYKQVNDKEKLKNARPSEGYRILCGIVNQFFDNIFGDGTSEELFGGKNDVADHLQAVDEFNTGLKEHSKEFKDLLNKYSQRQQAMPHHHGRYTKKRHKSG